MATRKNKVSWVIVVFLDSKDYSVVPTKWLVQNDSNNLTNSTVRFCFWPLGRVSSTDIHDALDPEASWIQYSIKIVGGNKTYDDFKKAWHIRVEKESESEEVQLLPKRKRTILNVSASSSDDDSESYSITPASTNSFKSSSNEKAVQYQELISVNNSTSQKQSQPTETFQPLLSEQNMSYQSSSEYQPQYTQSTTVYQPPSQDIQTKCQKLGSISSRHFRRIVNAAKEKCVMSTTSLPLRPYLIPPVVNINAIVSTEILTPSINTEVFNCHDSNVLNSVNHLENPSLDFSETPNLTDNKNGISDKLRDWIIHFKISHNAANSLLTVLQSEGMKVPKDVRTLMHTPKTKEMVNISNGSYIHLGLRDMLLPLLEINDFNKHTSDNILRIGINIDGLPIAKSSKSQLWPILISILNFKELPNNVLPIGIFHFFDSKHSRPPSTKPSAEPIWTTINRLPLPVGFFGPVDSPFRNASLCDFIVLSIHTLLQVSPAFTHVSSRKYIVRPSFL
ncbi:uncharacterized protein LOC132932708 [Metopolophium dirhodum]|uniref:uncharacterized protein LOC132932708 n=1 Tax=Metopolophium dirhodum TaxID=44670 RepID=UPI00298F7AE3|nr:uncharacterized protein LOC132932708 [Metopolophium dirhodum]